MAQMNLTEALGLDVDGGLSPNEQLTKLMPDFLRLKDLPLNKLPLQNMSLKLSFNQPFKAQAGDLNLMFGGSTEGSLNLIDVNNTLGDDGGPLDDLVVQAGEKYLALKLKFALAPGFTVPAGSFVFGFATDKELEISCFRRFSSKPEGFPAFGRALGLVLAAFSMPRSASELAEIDSDTVLIMTGLGELSVSGTVSVQTPVQSIASASIGFGKQIQVQAGASAGVAVKFSVIGGYGIRLRGLQGKTTELGIFQQDRRETALKISAQVGVSATVGGFDLIEKLIDALSRQPEVDKKEFTNAISDSDDASKHAQILEFQEELSSAVSTKLEAAIDASLSVSRGSKLLWIFDVDTTRISAEAQAAIRRCLAGDFTGLTENPKRLEPSVTETKNLSTTSRATAVELQLNLFGIVNALSLVQIARVSKVERNANGDVTLITDAADAERVKAVLLNGGWDAKRLRKFLSEEFLLSAAYQVSKVGVFPPSFRAKHTYLDIAANTSKEDLEKHFDIARILGLLSRDKENQILSGAEGGRTTFFVQTTYSGDGIRSLFLDEAGRPRSSQFFENAGRSALAAMLAGRKGQEFRLSYASLGSGDELWGKMKQLGNVTEFGPLFGVPKGQSDNRVSAVGVDYEVITSWAKAMTGAASAVYEVESLFGDLALQVDNEQLSRARQELSKRMADVTSQTHDEFGDPLGLLMVYVAANENGAKRVLVTGDRMQSIDLSSETQLAAGGA